MAYRTYELWKMLEACKRLVWAVVVSVLGRRVSQIGVGLI